MNIIYIYTYIHMYICFTIQPQPSMLSMCRILKNSILSLFRYCSLDFKKYRHHEACCSLQYWPWPPVISTKIIQDLKHLITSYNPIHRRYNPIEISTYNSHHSITMAKGGRRMASGSRWWSWAASQRWTPTSCRCPKPLAPGWF